MAQVDSHDDSIWRFTLRHYRYDPDRKERRHVEVASFDDEPEFYEELACRQRELEERRRQGTADPREHFTGLFKEPGYEARRQKRKRAARMRRAQTVRRNRDTQRHGDE